MENASKALIIAGSILIGIIIISIGVYLFRNSAMFSNTYTKEMDRQQIMKFNADYEKYLR